VYNFKGLQARFCRAHKEDGMVTNKEKTCHEEGCENPATHKESRKKAFKKMCCAEHKEEGMIRLNDSSNVCETEGCTKSKSFNFSGEKARFCMAWSMCIRRHVTKKHASSQLLLTPQERNMDAFVQRTRQKEWSTLRWCPVRRRAAP
jgi:hypothetical protein